MKAIRIAAFLLLCAPLAAAQAQIPVLRDSIGREKAGILRSGQHAICGEAKPPDSLLVHAKTLGLTMQLLGHDFHFALTYRPSVVAPDQIDALAGAFIEELGALA